MRRAALLLLLPLLPGCSSGGDHESVGSTAPEIAARAWLQEPPEGTSLADLRGRVVYLDFWATW